MDQPTIRTATAWIAQILSALIVLGAAAGKLLGSSGWIERFRNWGYPDGFSLVIGVLELLGAIALLVPPDRRTRGSRPARDHARCFSHTSLPR
jgi:uncharacterized membrane protein YphA (DoxX/SURF4 family)